MNLDIRVPIGLLFTLLGALLAWWGATSDPYADQDRWVSVNVNLDWGVVLLIFGLAMLAAVWLGRRRKPPAL